MQSLTDFTDWLALQPAGPLLILAILGLIVFILGLLIGYGVQGSKTRAAYRKLERSEKEKDELRQKLAEGDEEQKTLARQLVKITTEKDDTLVQLREVSSNLDQIGRQLQKLQANNEQLTATNQSYATTIEDLNDQVIGLKTRNEQLLRGGGSEPMPSAMAEDGLSLRQLESRVAALEARHAASTVPDVEPEPVFGAPAHRVRIGSPAPAEADSLAGDDLTRIHTIGPFNAGKLREAGITAYAQIAAWDDNDLEDYAARIGYVADIMREEDWIGQARRLA